MPYREAARVEVDVLEARMLARRQRAERRLAWSERMLTGRVTPLDVAPGPFYLDFSLGSLLSIPMFLLVGCAFALIIAGLRTIPAIVRESAERTLYGAPIHRAHGSKAFLVLVALAIPPALCAHGDARVLVAIVGALVALGALFVAATHRELAR